MSVTQSLREFIALAQRHVLCIWLSFAAHDGPITDLCRIDELPFICVVHVSLPPRKSERSDKEQVLKEALSSVRLWEARYQAVEASRQEYRSNTRQLASENEVLQDAVTKVNLISTATPKKMCMHDPWCLFRVNQCIRLLDYNVMIVYVHVHVL